LFQGYFILHFIKCPDAWHPSKIAKLGSYEERKIGVDESFISFLHPLFLTSALPIFAAVQPEDEIKASREMRPRSTP